MLLYSICFGICLNIILEDSLNIIFEEYVLGDATYIKLERIRTEWETIHVFNICVSYVARKACFQKLDFLCLPHENQFLYVAFSCSSWVASLVRIFSHPPCPATAWGVSLPWCGCFAPTTFPLSPFSLFDITLMFETSGKCEWGELGWVLVTTGLCTIDKTAVRVLWDSIFVRCYIPYVLEYV